MPKNNNSTSNREKLKRDRDLWRELIIVLAALKTLAILAIAESVVVLKILLHVFGALRSGELSI